MGKDNNLPLMQIWINDYIAATYHLDIESRLEAGLVQQVHGHHELRHRAFRIRGRSRKHAPIGVIRIIE